MDVKQFQPKSKRIICKTLQLYSKIMWKREKIIQTIFKEKKRNGDFSYQISDNKFIVMKTV